MLLLAAYLPACTAYHQTDEPLAQLTASPKPAERLCITKRSGVEVEVWAPSVIADSVVGMNAAPGKEPARIAIALSDIHATAVRKVDAEKTVGAVLAVGAMFGLALLLGSIMANEITSGL